MMKTIFRGTGKVVAYFFVVLFSFASVQKYFDFRNFRTQLKAAPELGMYGEPAAFFIVTTQVLVVILLCWKSTRFIGFFLTIMLLSVFMVYLSKILLEKNLPCECLGIVKGLSWQHNFFLNLLFLLVGFVGMSSWVREIKKK